MSGIMSSPAPIESSPRALREIDRNRAPLTPDASPTRKRQKVQHSPNADKWKLGSEKPVEISNFKLKIPKKKRTVTSLSRLMLANQIESGFSTRKTNLYKFAREVPETFAFCSRPSERDVLTDLHPWFQCDPMECCAFSVAPFHNSNDVAIGLQGGHICFSKIGESGKDRKHTHPYGGLKSVANDAVLDVDISQSDRLAVMGSGDGFVKVFDVAKQQVLFETHERGTRVKQAKFCPNNENLILAGNSDGAMFMVDLRQPADASKKMCRINNSLKGIHKTQRNNLGMTALTWLNYMQAASASETYSAVKFWDFRYFKPYSTYKSVYTGNTCSAPPTQKRHFGITSLVYDGEDNKVWAMSRDSHIYSIHGSSPDMGVIDDLYSEHLKVGSFYTRMAVMNSGGSSSRYGPSQSYLVCGGGAAHSAALFPKPPLHGPLTHSRQTDISPILLSNGHEREVTDVAVNSYSGRIATVSDDGTARYWGMDFELSREYREVNPVINAAWALPADQ